MKIVALHTDFRIYWPARLSALAKALNRRGDTLDVIEIAGEGSHYVFAERDVKHDLSWHILFPKGRPEKLSSQQIKYKLFPVLDRINPDVIIAGAIAFPSGALAVAWGQKHCKRVIVFDDAKAEVVQRNGIVNYIKQAVYNGVDAMLYPAPDWSGTGKYWGFEPQQMFYGVDVVDNDFWSTPQELNHSWGNYFVAVGRQIPKKNFISIVKAYLGYVDLVGQSAYNLVLIGDGPEHQSLMELVEQSGYSDKVFFMPFMSQNDLPAVYQNAKAICCCSVEETWGLVINEAMAGGCPVIASVQCGATNTLVQDGVNGYTFSYENIDRLSELMFVFSNLPDSTQLMMRNASRRIIAEWGLERFSNSCCEAIDYVMSYPKRITSVIDKSIIKLWKGRYRPI